MGIIEAGPQGQSTIQGGLELPSFEIGKGDHVEDHVESFDGNEETNGPEEHQPVES